MIPGRCGGVAIVSHPVNRMLNHGGYTAEVRRVCTKRGAPKGSCSMLYSACLRAWKAMGGAKIIIYTLQSELGTSLKASGWKRVARSPGSKPGQSLEYSSRASGGH